MKEARFAKTLYKQIDLKQENPHLVVNKSFYHQYDYEILKQEIEKLGNLTLTLISEAPEPFKSSVKSIANRWYVLHIKE